MIEVLAALLFMAIVIPAAMQALHVASMSGEVAVRKAAATRLADQVLNQNIATTNWTQYSSGTILQGGHEYRWSLRTDFWPVNTTIEMLTAEVGFSVQGHDYSVHLNTLEMPLSMTATNNLQ